MSVFEWGARAYDLLSSHSLWREHAGGLLEYLPADDLLRVLDLGCGPGVSAFALAERLGAGVHVVGVDLARRMLERASQHHRTEHRALKTVSFARANACLLPFADGTFDGVTGHSFLYLVPDPLGVLREAYRVLAPGGRLVMLEPRQGGSLRRAAPLGLGHAGELLRRPWAAARFTTAMVVWRFYSDWVGRLDPEGTSALLREAGFVDVGHAETLGGIAMHCFGRRP